MEKLKRIVLGTNTYPIKMDLNVLEHIQEEYGTINKFEMEILGLRFRKDRDGKQIYNKDGNPMMYKAEPSVRAIKAVLPMMINEGMEIEAAERKESWGPVSEKEIFQKCNVNFEFLAEIIHEEFKRCFEIKK